VGVGLVCVAPKPLSVFSPPFACLFFESTLLYVQYLLMNTREAEGEMETDKSSIPFFPTCKYRRKEGWEAARGCCAERVVLDAVVADDIRTYDPYGRVTSLAI